MKFMRHRSIAVVVSLIIIALVYRYGYLMRGGVAAELETQARERTLQPFRMTDIAAFPWDRVVFLEPYDNQAVADRALGFHWPDFQLFGLEYSDGFSLVVFANSENVVRAEKVGRCRPDFSKELVGKAVIRVNATFAIENTSDCRVLKLANELPSTRH
jgi:hypothetical protein